MSTPTENTSAFEAARWAVTDVDGTVMIVQRFADGEPVMVAFDFESKTWGCSVDGLQSSTTKYATNAPSCCVHVMAACRTLPIGVAYEILAVVQNKTKVGKGGPLNGDGKRRADTEAEAMMAEALARGADARAARAAEHDEAFQPVVGPVAVRTMTDEDRVKLEERRGRKHRRFGAPDPE